MVGLTYHQLAQQAEYDQSVATKAIHTFSDFIALYPKDPRVDQARTLMIGLKYEQARGAFLIATYYEKKKTWHGASVYFNEVLDKDPTSTYANQARRHLDTITARMRNESPAAEQ
jgi:outer membrane protein assembly factor BamD (BamD/ComL family)